MFFTRNPNIHLCTARTVSRYWYSAASGHGPTPGTTTWGLEMYIFRSSPLLFFCSTPYRQPRPSLPNDNTLSENTQMRLDFKNKITSSDVRTVIRHILIV